MTFFEIFKDCGSEEMFRKAIPDCHDFVCIEETDKYQVFMCDSAKIKAFRSPGANYFIVLDTGLMVSWGNTFKDDPEEFPVPNILDWEVTTICKKKCSFCYKSNDMHGTNLSFERFKEVFDHLPKSITQIAFGADYDLTSNPDIFKMMEYARQHDVVPNVTVGYLDDEAADKISQLCGAVAVSIYDPKDKAYDTVEKLCNRGMRQVNIHFMISEETYDKCIETIDDIKNDPRLKGLNALVLLSLKKKGRGTGYHVLSQDKFNAIVDRSRKEGISIGFDSCTSLKAFRAFQDDPNVRDCIIPCEASIESSYINVDCEYFPCSFIEGYSSESLDWNKGIDVTSCKSPEDFMNKVWYHEKTKQFKQLLQNTCKDNCENCRHCPAYEV